MTFKILSKHNVGIATLLLLVILLSQARVFNFLFDNALGRSLLILLLIFISYTNKILGVVTVLLIIIMFNNSNIGYMEGFTDKTPNVDTVRDRKSNGDEITNEETIEETKDTNEDRKNIINKARENRREKIQEKRAEADNTESTTATEGFDVLATERTLQKGKNANSISVNSSVRNSDSINAFDGSSTFSSLFSTF
jgi:hypothetical protein